jgi:hypothetical protein
MTIPLAPPLPAVSSAANPDLRAEAALARVRGPRGPYSALLPVGLAVPVRLPVPRWALTPPFHPLPLPQAGQSVLCGAFPRVAPAGRYPAPLPCGVRTFLGRVRAAAIRPSARDAVKHPRPPVNGKAPREIGDDGPVGVVERPRGPGPEPQPHSPSQRVRVGRRPVAAPPGGGAASAWKSPGAAGAGQTDSPCRASRRQSKRGPGSVLRNGAMSECAITPRAGSPSARGSRPAALPARPSAARQRGSPPVLSSSIPIERELISPAPPPGAGAGMPGALGLLDQLPDLARRGDQVMRGDLASGSQSRSSAASALAIAV